MKQTEKNLIPNIKNPSPDYYCTWQTQLYATSDGRPSKQRRIIGENAMFDKEKPYGWAYFYEKIRGDLFFVMDDSWDVSLDGNTDYYGSLILNEEKFPSFTKGRTNAEALGALVARMKELGWKGLGGWVCAQEPEFCTVSPEEYWKGKVIEANEAGFAYWKVDWGKKDRNDPEFRKMLTSLAAEYSPGLTVEHSFVKSIIPCSHVFRTYDVPAIMSIPMTMEKLAKYTDVPAPIGEGYGLIDCEDEAYIAAAGGFAMGIMRHPYVGELPNGEIDRSFPPMHRNIKSKLYEVIRAARFHRIAPAFGVCGADTLVSEEKLDDFWQFINRRDEIEGWWLENMGSVFRHISEDGVLTKTAPAAIARRTAIPQVEPDERGSIPYCVAALNPSGVYSVATLGRTAGRDYYIPHCRVRADIGEADTLGVFGEYKELSLGVKTEKITTILMQDIASDAALDITEDIVIKNDEILISGELIHRIGRSAQPEDDTSEPGVIIKIIRK